ncbi:YdcF family protein [Roseibium aquae]|nr:YdcF family protein [Roseibium aquae]
MTRASPPGRDSLRAEPTPSCSTGSRSEAIRRGGIWPNGPQAGWSVPLRGLLAGGVLGFAFILIAFAGLFGVFAHKVSTASLPADPQADAIVVLTGGTERISQALTLLDEGRARRLLISGVHPGTTRDQIVSVTSADRPLFDCCVDLDRIALNTAGNATETAHWVKKHGFKTLLVVTSAYHLPRASLELTDTLPDIDLVPYPVYASGLDLSSWYSDRKTMQLLMREYVKYTLARLRIGASRIFG